MRAMPTSGKLVAGICFALVGYLTATAYSPGLPDGFRIGYFTYFSAALGFVVGWFVMGRLVGVGMRDAAGRGVSTAVWLFFWALLAFSIHEMLVRSLDKRYRNPMDAVGGAFEISIFFFKLALSVEVLATLLIGGLVSGILSELANRRWR